MVTVRTCYSLPEAQVVQSHLGGSGIETFLPDELTVQNNWLWANAIGGVRVQVPEEDAEIALEVLRESLSADAQKHCPQCGAMLKEKAGSELYANVVIALLLSMPIRTETTWHCPKCGIIPLDRAHVENQ